MSYKGSVRWTATNRDRSVVEKGTMEKGQIASSLREIEPAAMKLLKTTGAEHVMYGATVYGKDGAIAAVHFFLWPVDEDEFERVTRRCRGAHVYALHRR